MLTKRGLISGAAAFGAMSAVHGAAFAEESFRTLYDQALSDPSLITDERADTEDKKADFETRAVAPRVKPSALPISDDAVDLIVLFEVTSSKLYEQRYQKPVWPGGDSGVTIGVGYDLGYVKPEWFDDDWGGRLTPETLKRLKPSCGKRGDAAKALYKGYADVAIPWGIARPQFREKLLPLYTGLAVANLPPSAKTLPQDCLGALVSLVYNRGAPFKSEKARFREMKRIHNHLEDGALEKIPAEFLSMQRLWKDEPKMKGLVKRRELEAVLFRQGLEKA